VGEQEAAQAVKFCNNVKDINLNTNNCYSPLSISIELPIHFRDSNFMTSKIGGALIKSQKIFFWKNIFLLLITIRSRFIIIDLKCF